MHNLQERILNESYAVPAAIFCTGNDLISSINTEIILASDKAFHAADIRFNAAIFDLLIRSTTISARLFESIIDEAVNFANAIYLLPRHKQKAATEYIIRNAKHRFISVIRTHNLGFIAAMRSDIRRFPTDSSSLSNIDRFLISLIENSNRPTSSAIIADFYHALCQEIVEDNSYDSDVIFLTAFRLLAAYTSYVATISRRFSLLEMPNTFAKASLIELHNLTNRIAAERKPFPEFNHRFSYLASYFHCFNKLSLPNILRDIRNICISPILIIFQIYSLVRRSTTYRSSLLPRRISSILDIPQNKIEEGAVHLLQRI